MIYEDIFNQTVTVLNKLRRADNNSGKDIWVKTVLHNVAWYTKSAVKADGTSADISTYKIILIPFNSKYRPYSQWKTDHFDTFSMSVGDYILMGEIDDSINADNIIKTISKYDADVCIVKHISELHKRFNAQVQLKIEGV